jgi:hypothetical protein
MDLTQVGNLNLPMNVGDSLVALQNATNALAVNDIIEIESEGMVVTQVVTQNNYQVARGNNQRAHGVGAGVYEVTTQPLTVWLLANGYGLAWARIPNFQWVLGQAKVVSTCDVNAAYTFAGKVLVNGTQTDVLNYLQSAPS